ncbi:MAG: phosphodiester glycosidase family protein [Capsulimonadaceae bacterium]|nr:phosphodiester glycosidase family protein [Capsulimonadaceae bacterium]
MTVYRRILALCVIILITFPAAAPFPWAASAVASEHHKKSVAAKHHKQHVSEAKAKHDKKAAKHAKHAAAEKARAHKEHLARLHEIKLLKKQHAAEARSAKHKKVSAKAKAHLARLAAKEQHERRAAAKKHVSKAYRQHLARLAKLEHEHEAHLARLEAKERKARKSRMAASARIARYTSAAEHKERLARKQAALASKASARNTKQSSLQAAHNARLAAHNARVAAYEARVAQHEAWRREQQAQIDLAAANGIVQYGSYTRGVPLQVIMVDLNKPNIKVTALIARNGIGSSEPFGQMIERTHPAVAVTGTFFSLDNLKPVGDIVINGNLAYFGGMGTALAITPNNRADMVTVDWGRHHSWAGYDCVVACGPRLLKDGYIVLDPHAERFHDREMLSPNSRIAVGITPGNKLVFVMTRDRIYLGRLAKVMASLGCTQAMNLDAGTSTGFYCNGRMLARPGRQLTNAIVVHADGRHEISQSPHTLTAARSRDGG